MSHDTPTVSEVDGHQPVMVPAVLELLDPRPGQIILDATVGQGGHAAAIVPRLAPGGAYLGLDVDPVSLRASRARLGEASVPVTLRQANFRRAEAACRDAGLGRVDGLLADLGFSSTQMADGQRGLSFRAEGPLDMRLDPTLAGTAADLVNRLGEAELADLIYEHGEERHARRIARKIVESRGQGPIKTTGQLAELCRQAYRRFDHRGRIDPATRTFQALRIAVNDELAALGELLDAIPRLLKAGGVAVMISFHSLEDRMVKRTFRAWEDEGRGRRLTRKPRVPDELERSTNRRSRSARCRALQWTQDGDS